MRVAAFIPARGNSKRVPGKNLATVGGALAAPGGYMESKHGTSLLHRAIAAALHGLPEVDGAVYVSTDDEAIANAARNFCHCGSVVRGHSCYFRDDGGSYDNTTVHVHHRPPQLASDHAQIESALSHWWTRLDMKPDAVVLLQPTSPFRTAEHVRQAIALLHGANLDSVVGVTASHAPHFAGRMKPREGEPSGGGPSLWYEWAPFAPVVDASARPRTQDLRPVGSENGALYAFTREHWERTGNRLGGRMGALPMTWIEGLDIDTQQDLDAARAIAEGMGL